MVVDGAVGISLSWSYAHRLTVNLADQIWLSAVLFSHVLLHFYCSAVIQLHQKRLFFYFIGWRMCRERDRGERQTKLYRIAKERTESILWVFFVVVVFIFVFSYFHSMYSLKINGSSSKFFCLLLLIIWIAIDEIFFQIFFSCADRLFPDADKKSSNNNTFLWFMLILDYAWQLIILTFKNMFWLPTERESKTSNV